MKHRRTKVRNLASKAREKVTAAHREIASTAQNVEAIRRSTLFTDEGKTKDIGGWVESTRSKLSKEIAAQQRAARSAKEDAERKLSELRDVPAEELQRAATVLAPVIAAANQNLDALINAYVRRHTNLAEHRLLEDTADAMIDAGIGGVSFPEKWQRAQSAAEIPEAERETAAEAEHLQEIGVTTSTAPPWCSE